MGQRWALYIDVEGFGLKWNDSTMDAFRGINSLMQGIFWIGDRHYRDPPDRLFAHQFGDGFLVASDFHEESLDRAVLVAVALMRHLLAMGETAKCAVAEGELSDIQNCYPAEIRKRLQNWNIQFGSGVMTVSPVLGSALIHAVRTQKTMPSGPLLGLSLENSKRISSKVRLTPVNRNQALVNWLRGEPEGLEELQAAAGFPRFSEDQRAKQLLGYLASNTFPKRIWKQNARKYLLEDGV